MGYAIMHIAKRKMDAVGGLQLEANREPGDEKKREFPASAIDWSRTGQNDFFVQSSDWRKSIEKKCDEFGVRARKNSTVLVTGVYTASPGWLKGKSRAEQDVFFAECLAFHEKNYGEVINAVVHFDETTPHLQVASVPVYRDENGKGHLSARDMIGGRGELHEKQQDFFHEIGEPRGLEEPSPAAKTKRKHLSVQDYKLQQNEETIGLRKQEIRFLEKEVASARGELQEERKELERVRAEWESVSESGRELSRARETKKQDDAKIKNLQDSVEELSDILHEIGYYADDRGGNGKAREERGHSRGDDGLSR